MGEGRRQRDAEKPTARLRRLARIGALCLVVLAGGGCTRSYYRDYADQDVYRILSKRVLDWRWRVPERKVEADPKSRMADPSNPNRPPIPGDDPASRLFQVSSAFPFEYHGWKKRGTAPIEYLDWQKKLPTEDDDRVKLGRDSIMNLAIVNSREYQFNYEDLYLAALNLTLAQFQFMVQGFSQNGVFFQHLGNFRNNSNQLQLASANGFNKEFMTGAQLLVDLANTLVFEYSGKGFHVASPNLAINFTQPLLRGAWARIVTQALSLQERGVLYALRDFAHYRRVFYVNLIASNGYLGLLTQLQSIRNQEENLKSLERNLQMYEAELQGGYKTVLERDQVAQGYQQSQLILLQAEAGLQTQLDTYKLTLGLPPELKVRLDDSALEPFQLNDVKLDELRASNDRLYLGLYGKNDIPDSEIPRSTLAAAARQLQSALTELSTVNTKSFAELGGWQSKLDAERKKGFEGPDDKELKAIFERKTKLAGDLKVVLEETRLSLQDDHDKVQTLISGLDKAKPEDAVKTLRDDLVNKEFRSRLSELFVAQNQMRVFLIELKPVDLSVEQAIAIALSNRLDLKNALAQVTDAWRDIEVEANSLRGFLNFQYSGNLAAAPSHSTLYRFDASSSIHRMGLTFDAPINRRAERNAYRTAQITFQRARRAYMAARDQIVQQIRFDMRQILVTRKQFDIGREQLITTSRQVEEAEYALQHDPEGRPVTLNLLNALQLLLTARNTLIGTWVSYETSRLNLYRDFDLMDIDANGIWTNENDPQLLPTALRIAASAPAASLAIPAGPFDLSGTQSREASLFSDVKSTDRNLVVPDEAESPSNEGPLNDAELENGVAPPGGAPGVPGGGPGAPAGPPQTPSPFATRPQ
ncbi:MAG: TolC family protein [Paludisphaera borealis]|uniref:TolC family protein n=1 Tax=Paludisphaera borealis TaxID=1387353 RepID=UPI00284D23CA|nr:TolC family protein [Paludisphaera borealis]MDR3623296.1 TolC family protein [Paludisphaera borealis]